MISGSKIVLQTIEEKDLETLRNWRNNPNFRKFFREWKEISKSEQENWFRELSANKIKSIMFSIERSNDSKLIGCAGFNYVDWINNSAELSIYIGLNNIYIDPNDYALDTCKALFNYGFCELNFHKIWAEIYEFDNKKVKLFQNLGMKKDGILRDNCFHKGKYWNSLIYSSIQNEWF